MRVAIVCPYAWDRPGGVQTHTRSLAGALRERAHEALVVAPRSLRDAGPLEEGVVYAGRAMGVSGNGSVAPLALGPDAVIETRRALRALRPDVIHLHEPLLPGLCVAAYPQPHAPLVGTFHSASVTNAWYGRLRPALTRLVDRLAERTAVSDSARELARRYFPGDYVLTPNGVTVARFVEATPVDLGPKPVILFLSRIEARKGLDVLIRAMGELAVDARLVVAGSGPLESDSRSLASELGVDALFLGRVTDDLVPRLYRTATVYCAPATFGESFGIVLAEAMAAGTPVVCSDLPGFRAVAGVAAELVPPGDPGALAKALARVLSDQDIAREMARTGSRLAAGYDWSRLVAGVEAVYERAMH